MTTQEEQYAVIQQKQSQQQQEAQALQTESQNIEKRKAEAEALANQIKNKQSEIDQKYAPLIKDNKFVGSQQSEIQKTKETANTISRMGGDTSQFNPLVAASLQQSQFKTAQEYEQYKSDISSLQSLINTYNPQIESISKDVSQYNLKTSFFQSSKDQLKSEMDSYNKQIDNYNQQQKILEEAAKNWDVTPYISRGAFSGGYFGNPNPPQEKYAGAFPDLYTKYGQEKGHTAAAFEYELKMPYGGESGKKLANTEQEIRDAITQLYPEWQTSQLAEIQFAQKAAQQMASFRGFFKTPETFSSATAPIGTITDTQKALQAHIINPEQSAKIEYLKGTPEFASQEEYNKLALSVPYALGIGEKASILGSTPEQRALESAYSTKSEKLGQSFLNANYPTLFYNITSKDYPALAGALSISQQQLEQIKLKSEWKGEFTPYSAALAIAPAGTLLKDIQVPQAPQVPTLKALTPEQQRQEFLTTPAEQFWASTTPFRRFLYAAWSVWDTSILTNALYEKKWGEPTDKSLIAQGIFHSPTEAELKSVFQLESAKMGKQELSYTYSHQAPLSFREQLYLQQKEYDSLKGIGEKAKWAFEKSISSPTVQTLTTVETLGVGLGALSLKFPTATKIIGGGAIGTGIAEISYKAIQGDYAAAAVESGTFIASTPFAVQGYGVGREIKIPTITSVSFGTPITPEKMTTSGILLGAGKKLIEPIGIKVNDITLGVSRHLNNINTQINNIYSDTAFRIRGGSLEEGILPIRSTPYYEYGYQSMLGEPRQSFGTIQEPPNYALYSKRGVIPEIPSVNQDLALIKANVGIKLSAIAEIGNKRIDDLAFKIRGGYLEEGITPQKSTQYYEYGYQSMLGETLPQGTIRGLTEFNPYLYKRGVIPEVPTIQETINKLFMVTNKYYSTSRQIPINVVDDFLKSEISTQEQLNLLKQIITPTLEKMRIDPFNINIKFSDDVKTTGYFEFDSGDIYIKKGLIGDRAITTLFHEIGHKVTKTGYISSLNKPILEEINTPTYKLSSMLGIAIEESTAFSFEKLSMKIFTESYGYGYEQYKPFDLIDIIKKPDAYDIGAYFTKNPTARLIKSEYTIQPSAIEQTRIDKFVRSKLSDIGYKTDYELSRKLSPYFEIKDILSETSKRFGRDVYGILPKPPKNIHNRFNQWLYNELNSAFGGYDKTLTRIKVEGLRPEEIYTPYKPIQIGMKRGITAQRDWQVIDAFIKIAESKINPNKELKKSWKLREQSNEIKALEQAIQQQNPFKNKPLMQGDVLKQQLNPVLEGMGITEKTPTQKAIINKKGVVRDRTIEIKKQWQNELKNMQQFSEQSLKESGSQEQKQVQILLQKPVQKMIPKQAEKSISTEIEKTNKEIQKQISGTKRKSKQGIYPIFFPALIEGTEYDYSQVYPQQTIQKTHQKMINSIAVNANQQLKPIIVNTQKEEQKQSPAITTKPFTFTIPRTDTRQLFREMLVETPSQLSQLKSIQKAVLRELSLEMPQLKTSQKEMMREGQKFKVPSLTYEEKTPVKKEHRAIRKSSSYTIKNPFSTLEDIIGG